jgi:hypothetical protein
MAMMEFLVLALWKLVNTTDKDFIYVCIYSFTYYHKLSAQTIAYYLCFYKQSFIIITSNTCYIIKLKYDNKVEFFQHK